MDAQLLLGMVATAMVTYLYTRHETRLAFKARIGAKQAEIDKLDALHDEKDKLFADAMKAIEDYQAQVKTLREALAVAAHRVSLMGKLYGNCSHRAKELLDGFMQTAELVERHFRSRPMGDSDRALELAVLEHIERVMKQATASAQAAADLSKEALNDKEGTTK